MYIVAHHELDTYWFCCDSSSNGSRLAFWNIHCSCATWLIWLHWVIHYFSIKGYFINDDCQFYLVMNQSQRSHKRHNQRSEPTCKTDRIEIDWLIDWCLTPLSTSKVISWRVSFIGGGNRRPSASYWRTSIMHTCKHVCSGWRHVIISTVL